LRIFANRAPASLPPSVNFSFDFPYCWNWGFGIRERDT
jgi:hypothetical protein